MAKIRSAKSPGAPKIKMLRRAPWPPIRKPMRRIATVRTLRKVDESKGQTMPESRNLLQRAGVGVRQRAPGRVLVKAKMVRPGKNLTRVKTPSATNRGGVRDPYRKR